ncbi:MAG TPA: hypothetical protein VFK05_01675 [Polyangiaceae bacterium]|nr:hypothetical protein [Polyangiaceae bacterium]
MNLPELTQATRTAHWGWHEHRYFGHRVFQDLAGRETLTGLTILSVLGRRLPSEAAGVVDDIACTLTLADPRIWPLKLTRLIAAYGSTLPAAAAGLLSEEEARIGPWAGAKSAEVLLAFDAAIGARVDEAETVRQVVTAYLDEHRFVWGFGTPFRAQDERLVAFRDCIQRRQRDSLPFWRLMTAVSEVVRELRGAEPNMGIAVAAALLDLGLTAHQAGCLSSALMQHMFLAQAVEGAEQGSSLRELPASYVEFVGHAPRSSPRAGRGDSER